MLCPNIKIIELILLNPQKYRCLKIINNIVSSKEKYNPERKVKSEKINIQKTYDDIPRISFDENKKVSEHFHIKNIYNNEFEKNKKSYTPSSSSLNIRKNIENKIIDNEIIYSMRDNDNNNNYNNKNYNNFKSNNKLLKYESSKYINTNSEEYSDNSNRDFDRRYIIKQRDFYHEKSAMRQKPGILFNNNLSGKYSLSNNSEENYDFDKDNNLNYNYKRRNNNYDNTN